MDEPNPPVVVICGGSAGVGRATAHRFAAAGYRVGLLARGAQALADTEDELQQRGTRTLGIGVDVADAAAVLEAARRIEHELGPVQVWINCAMTTVFSPVRQLSAEEIQRVTSVTYLGTVHGTMAALALMEPRDRGVIIQVGSALAYRAIPLQAAYCGAKFAVRGFTDSLRCELLDARSGIRVCMVQLPAINTPQFDWARNKLDKRPQPVPPIHDPDVAARAILSVVRRTPRELWLGAASVKAIVGTCLMPGLLDRLLARRACTGQMTREDDDGQRPDNLFESQQSLHRIQGRFSGQSRADALALSSTQVSALLLAVGGLLAVTLLLF
ncbi:SDR family oxidoreductase [Pseudomonas sp. 21TX0197]|uniref:SDR family oxidoreductase n=1 Tax=unclassified Pseudomonas TaxID=196821 RepID=UPI00092187CD|nr:MULTISPECIES: SDR family oxidoreductase [unclassified Pseudomonas]MDB6442692.1 SDR family oxidoreductase [Pseudomonas sp. 21TX0197]SFX65359.1 NADP-dependent 3-hydroxy acid dehydrogenase YdfG [Pseudomonas sp. NFACC49-2]SFX90736.1 NADP-dependent 3-hydroxy acid dehydrogenase YdfG [Pseudomonas sp. NFACC36]